MGGKDSVQRLIVVFAGVVPRGVRPMLQSGAQIAGPLETVYSLVDLNCLALRAPHQDCFRLRKPPQIEWGLQL